MKQTHSYKLTPIELSVVAVFDHLHRPLTMAEIIREIPYTRRDTERPFALVLWRMERAGLLRFEAGQYRRIH